MLNWQTVLVIATRETELTLIKEMISRNLKMNEVSNSYQPRTMAYPHKNVECNAD